MKFVLVFALFCLVLVTKEVTSELIKAENTAHRWPVATARCPSDKRMLGGGGNCRSLDGRGWVFLFESRPVDENSFIVRCDTPEQQFVVAEAYVICEPKALM